MVQRLFHAKKGGGNSLSVMEVRKLHIECILKSSRLTGGGSWGGGRKEEKPFW